MDTGIKFDVKSQPKLFLATEKDPPFIGETYFVIATDSKGKHYTHYLSFDSHATFIDARQHKTITKDISDQSLLRAIELHDGIVAAGISELNLLDWHCLSIRQSQALHSIALGDTVKQATPSPKSVDVDKDVDFDCDGLAPGW